MRFEEFSRGLIGDWRGTKQLYLAPPPEPPASSPSTLSVSALAGDAFLQFSYNWSYEGEAQSGVLWLGVDDEDAATVAWVDSFHMSSRIMFCTGKAHDGSAEVLGSYAAPPGPDWSWRITIQSASTAELKIVMHNISPEGQEDLAVQIDYARAG